MRRGSTDVGLGAALPRHDRRRRPGRLEGTREPKRACAGRSGASSSPAATTGWCSIRSRRPTVSTTAAGRSRARAGCSGRRKVSTGAASSRRAWRTSSSSGRSTGRRSRCTSRGSCGSASRGTSKPLTGDGFLVVEGPGDLVWRYPLTVEESGSFYWKFDEPDLPTGTYRVRFEFPDSELELTGTASFRKEAYRLPQFEVRLDAPERAALDRPFDVDLTASYYAGGRVAARPIAWRVTQFPYDWTPKARTGFFYSSDGRFSRVARFESTPALERTDTHRRVGERQAHAQPGGRGDRAAAHLRRRGDGGRRRRPDGDRDALDRRAAAVRARTRCAALRRASDRRRAAARPGSRGRTERRADRRPEGHGAAHSAPVACASARQRLLGRRRALRHRSGGREGARAPGRLDRRRARRRPRAARSGGLRRRARGARPARARADGGGRSLRRRRRAGGVGEAAGGGLRGHPRQVEVRSRRAREARAPEPLPDRRGARRGRGAGRQPLLVAAGARRAGDVRARRRRRLGAASAGALPADARPSRRDEAGARQRHRSRAPVDLRRHRLARGRTGGQSRRRRARLSRARPAGAGDRGRDPARRIPTARRSPAR